MNRLNQRTKSTNPKSQIIQIGIWCLVLGIFFSSVSIAAPLSPGIYHFNEGEGDYSIFVPTKNEHKMIVALHGSGERADGYIKNWLKEAGEHNYIVLVPNAFNKWGWSIDDVERILSRTRHFQKEFKIKKTLLSGASAGGQFALYVGINHFDDFDGIATFMGTLMGGPSRWIEFQDDPKKRIPIYMVHGTKDEMIPAIHGELSSRFIKARGYDVTFKEINEMKHEHYRPANKDIIKWFENKIIGQKN